jgi:quinol monooxygenase YgiN
MTEKRKYIVGWLTCRPGKREALLRLFAPYARTCLQEDGCLSFEVCASVHDADVVTVAECFASEEAHEQHLRGDAFVRFWARLPEHCLSGRFENIYPRRVEADAVTFAD